MLRISAATIVDELTINGVNVSTLPTPQGEITMCIIFLRDFDGNLDPCYLNEFPVDAPIGFSFYAEGYYQNTLEYIQNMWITVDIIDPYGNIVATTGRVAEGAIAPGVEGVSPNTPEVALDIEGMWQVHILLEAEIIT